MSRRVEGALQEQDSEVVLEGADVKVRVSYNLRDLALLRFETFT